MGRRASGPYQFTGLSNDPQTMPADEVEQYCIPSMQYSQRIAVLDAAVIAQTLGRVPALLEHGKTSGQAQRSLPFSEQHQRGQKYTSTRDMLSVGITRNGCLNS